MNDAGRLVLRVAVGGLLLLQGVFKILNGVSGIEGAIVGHGLPGFIAYGVYAGEVVGPIMVILGFFARVGAALIVVNMLVAVGLAHMNDIAALNAYGGYRLEVEAFFLLGAIAVGLLGAGKLSVGGGRYN